MTGFRRPTASEIHELEQRWHFVNSKLDTVLGFLKHDMGILQNACGTDDATVVYDYMLNYILKSYEIDPVSADHSTKLLCAAAFTRLARASRIEDRDHIDMTPFESEAK